jgi:DNA-binding transcriptional LysR family regulator
MIRYLRTFTIAAETESFSAAGNRLGLTQSAVSTQIRRLEEELGCALFDRTGKSVTLSNEGREALGQAAQILEIFEGLKQQSRRGADRTPIQLGVITSVQDSFLPKALIRFRREHPVAQINIVPGTSIQLLTRVDSHEMDIAVMVKPRLGLPSDLKWIPLMHERYVGIAPEGWPGDLGELLRERPFIRYDRRSHGGQLVDRFLKRHGYWTNDSIELDEPSVILSLVSEGLGCSIIPGELVPIAQTTGIKVLSLPGRPLLREVGVLVRLSAMNRPSTTMLLESFTAEAQALVSGLRLVTRTTA